MKVVFLGCTNNYGLGFSANVTKIGYMAKGLTEAGADCVIHNGILGTTKVTKDQEVEHDGHKVTTFKKRGNFIISYFRNLRRYYKYIKKERVKNDTNVVIVSRSLPHILVTDWLICKILGYKYVVISHEWSKTIVNAKKTVYLAFLIYSKIFGKFADAILPISEYIIKKIEHFKKPYFKLPIIADFGEEYECTPKSENNFVYCASVYYVRIIKMIINAYAIYKEKGGEIKLTMILNGPENVKQDIAKYIEEKELSERIVIKSKLPYKELINEYLNAKALLIPLDPNYEQDEARFSQKIAEYLASRRPIITNNVGEIKYYFKKDEAIICDFTEDAFAKTFKWVEEHKEECDVIGENGYRRGVVDFNYKSKGVELYNFLLKL